MDPPTHNIPVNKLIVGDCIDLMAAWPANCVDLIFADPPYNIGYTYDQYDDSRSPDDYVDWSEQWIDGCVRLLKPTGSLYILIGDEYAAQVRMHLRHHEACKNLLFRNWIIWHYTFGQNCKAKFNRSHAHLFYCVGSASLGKTNLIKDQPFTFNRQAIAVPSARQTTYADRRANPRGKLPDDTWYLRPQETDGTFFQPDGDTWYQSRLCGTFKERVPWHPCQLPKALLERVVKVSSHPEDLVFDPFAGSGTTLAVAHQLGRNWLGCELSQDYATKATERIQGAKAIDKQPTPTGDQPTEIKSTLFCPGPR